MVNLRKSPIARTVLLFIMVFSVSVSCVFAKSQVDRKFLERLMKIDYSSGTYAYADDISLGESLSKDEITSQSMLRDIMQAVYLGQNDRNKEASLLLSDASSSRTDWPDAIRLLQANFLSSSGNDAAVQQACRHIIETSPQYVPAYIVLAEILNNTNKSDEAVAILDKARKVAPRNFRVLESLGKVYVSQLRTAYVVTKQNEILDNMVAAYEDLTDSLTSRQSLPFLNAIATIRIEQKKYDQAVSALTKAIRIAPDKINSYLRLIECQQKVQDSKGALETARQAATYNPDDEDLLKAIRTMTGGADGTIRFYKELSDQYPGRDDIRLRYAQLLQSAKRNTDAVTVLRSVVQMHPHNRDAWMLLAKFEHEQGHAKAAQDAIRSYIAQSPYDANTLETAMDFLVDNGYADYGLKCLDDLRKLHPDHPRILSLAYDIAMQQKDYERAVGLLEEGLERNPSDWLACGHLIEVLAMLNRTREALPYLDKAIETAPKDRHYELLGIRALVCQQAGLYDEAEKTYRKCLISKPNDMQVQIALASIYADTDRFDEARAMLKQIEKDHASKHSAWFEAGMVYDKMKDFPSTEECLRKAIGLNADYAEAYNALGYILCERGERLNEALDLIRKALSLDPGKGYIIDSLGWVYYKKGNISEAVRTLESAVRSSDTPDPEMLVHLGKAYLKADRSKDALSQFKAALATLPPGKDRDRVQSEIDKIAHKEKKK
jgi:tetratricopeptide (TPR) repeat protein